MNIHLQNKSWVTISEEVKVSDTVIVPLGSLEAHGAHKPVGCCYHLAVSSSNDVGERTGIPVTPVIPFGVADAYKNFPGTITVSTEALNQYVYGVSESLVRAGFKKIVFFSAHGGNNLAVLREISFRLREEHGTLCSVIHVWAMVSKVTPLGFWDPDKRMGHGGEPTTSVMLHLHPELVDMARAEDQPLKQKLQGLESRSYGLHSFQGVPQNVYLFADEVQTSGFMGDPTGASAEKGKVLYQKVVDYLVDFMETFRKLDPAQAQ